MAATPQPTPPPVLSFADGVTDAPLVPSSISPPSPRVGDSVTAVLDGYMTRDQKWTGTTIELWPKALGRRGEEYGYHDLVYGGSEEGRLTRWGAMRYTAVMAALPAEWTDREAEIKERLAGVFADVAGAGGPTFAWYAGGLGLGHGQLTVLIDPDHECLESRYVACTRWWRDGNTVTQAELIFSEPDYALNDRISMHMMGYAIGLNDWSGSGSVMTTDWSGRSATFHEVERNAIHMMYQHRNPGNAPPDRDPVFTPSGRGKGMGVHQEGAGG